MPKCWQSIEFKYLNLDWFGTFAVNFIVKLICNSNLQCTHYLRAFIFWMNERHIHMQEFSSQLIEHVMVSVFCAHNPIPSYDMSSQFPFFNYRLCQLPFKYRFSIRKSDHIPPIDLTNSYPKPIHFGGLWASSIIGQNCVKSPRGSHGLTTTLYI